MRSDPQLVACDYSTQKIWFGFQLLWNVMTHLQMPLILHFVECFLFLGLSFPSSHSFLNLLCHSKARALDIVLSPYSFCSNESTSVEVFPSQTGNSSWFVVWYSKVLQQNRVTKFFGAINTRMTSNKSLWQSVRLT